MFQDINDIIPWLQGVAGLLWLAPTVLFLPALRRVARKKGDNADLLGTVVALNGLLQFGFFVRWRIFPALVQEIFGAEAAFWIGLYTASALIALLAVYVGGAGWKR